MPDRSDHLEKKKSDDLVEGVRDSICEEVRSTMREEGEVRSIPNEVKVVRSSMGWWR